MRLPIFMMFALGVLGTASGAGPVKQEIELNSERIGVLGLPMAESANPVHRIEFRASVDEKGEGTGTLVLDLTEAPAYDEFGFVTAAATARSLKLDCTLKFVKKTTRVSAYHRPGSPDHEDRETRSEWKLYAITGPRIASRLSLSLQSDTFGQPGLLLVQDGNGKVRHVVYLRPTPPTEPCHPGCFPAGTPVRVPGGTSPIEVLREGDPVSTIGADGRPSTGTVTGLFATRNRLLEIRTAAGMLVTTETQPLALEDGGYRPAGELKPGDRIWRWDGSGRRAESVREVAPTGRESPVFNLVLGNPTTFIAGDFLARSKPPAVGPRP